ncbi:hypothetical protein MMC18_000399 [Xylographa bjoerkii]|nr:hypothetical protein [Xylographa bjoerkii]
MYTGNTGWHEGEQKMHSLMHIDLHMENPTYPCLTGGGGNFLQTAPLVAIGTHDLEGRLWTTLWGGAAGFSRSLGSSIIEIKTLVDKQYDPVVEALLGHQLDGKITETVGAGCSVSGLAIDLAARRRLKFAGHVVAGALGQLGPQTSGVDGKLGEAQIVIKVDSSLGNCPKYLNRKDIVASPSSPKLISSNLPLPSQALELLHKADLFFLTSSDERSHMSTNHRGGSPGFVRVMTNDSDGVTLAYPEYSGNRFYQTLGNLQLSPKAGLVFPNFDNGDVLYITATTEIIAGKDAAAVIPRSNLIVKVLVQEARFVQSGLSFRGLSGERSPYNPSVRCLATEGGAAIPQGKETVTVNVKLLKREALTPTIARFRFGISDPNAAGRWTDGQYVALSFENELSVGYSHMRDDDPRSLNDDYTRTFTISSPPSGDELPDDEFEITIRNVGVVTDFMFKQNVRAGLEVPLQGFGGEFVIEQRAGKTTPVVAGGIGITPLLGQISRLDLNRLHLFWSINIQDIGLVLGTFQRVPGLAFSTSLFVSGADLHNTASQQPAMAAVEAMCPRVARQRISAKDLEVDLDLSGRWYICTGTALKTCLLHWLAVDVAASCPSVIARIPPSLSSTTNPCFTATPSGYFQGIFYETYSSATSLQALKNVWLDTTHDSTTGGNDDLTSYQVVACSDNHVYTSYSNNSFEAGKVDVFPFHLGGTSASTTYLQELVSYGTDTGGNGYFVSQSQFDLRQALNTRQVMYGNDPNKDLVIASKVATGQFSEAIRYLIYHLSKTVGYILQAEELLWCIAITTYHATLTAFSKGKANLSCPLGPTSPTVSGIKSAISALGNSALNTLVSDLKAITHDNARSGQSAPTCTTTNCLTNVDSYSGTCK